jgi:hypothetical protein
MTPNLFVALLGEEHGETVRSALLMLLMVGSEPLRAGLDRLAGADAIGPMVDPSAWLDGRRFENTREARELLEALVRVAEMLEASAKKGGAA